MKNLLGFLCLSLLGGAAYAQTNITVTSTEVDNILQGNYVPGNYTASSVINDPGIISAGLINGISPDSLKADIMALIGFKTRNTYSDTVSSTRGIGAARRWAFNKFQQYSNLNEGRLRPAYLQFDWVAGAPCSGRTQHRNVMAVLPGSQVINPALIIIEAHLDSRCVGLCDITCDAQGAGDNAAGASMVLELARVLSKYTFRSTIVFCLTIGEEQSEMGAVAFAKYCQTNGIDIKAVNNNDVSGGTFCGHSASSPGCTVYGDIDSIGLRVFSLGNINSPKKQWARYIKLEYKEQVKDLVDVVTDIQIMSPDERTGRSGDHQPFTAKGYTAVRFTQANEDGNANSSSSGYKDRQHTSHDSLGTDFNSDGSLDTVFLDMRYLARNALVNGNSMAMVALGPDTIRMNAGLWTANRVRVQFFPAGAPAYRVAIRSLTNDWDSVYTVTGKSVDTLKVPYGTSTNFFISAAAVDSKGTESQFSTEYTLSTGLVILALGETQPITAPPSPNIYGIELLQNKPNPFDLATDITIASGTDVFADRAWIYITALDGKVIRKLKVNLRKGMNVVQYDHGFGIMGIYIYSLVIDGLPVQSRKMIFGRR